MNEYPRVKVTGAPGFEDYEGDLILMPEGPDGTTFAVVGSVWDGKPTVEVHAAKYVEVLDDVAL